jgi:hypothetical protein
MLIERSFSFNIILEVNLVKEEKRLIKLFIESLTLV